MDKVKVGGKSHVIIYLVDKFGRPGLSQSPPLAVSEKLQEHNTPQQENGINKDQKDSQHLDTDLLSRKQGEGQRSSTAGRARQVQEHSPDPRNPKTKKGSMA